MAEDSPRQEFQFSLSTVDRGKITIKMFDRINVDDVVTHLINREVFRIISGIDTGVEVKPLFRDTLIKERFTTGR